MACGAAPLLSRGEVVHGALVLRAERLLKWRLFSLRAKNPALGPDGFARDHNLHPPVLLPARGRIVAGHRIGGPHPVTEARSASRPLDCCEVSRARQAKDISYRHIFRNPPPGRFQSRDRP